MKRLIFLAIVLLLLVVVGVWGDRIAGRTLHAQLGPLLTRELGLPVKLAPIKARLFTLKATTANLVMGDPDNPAVVASNVEVRLAWSDLLRREIRLVYANADDLMVRPANWPSSDGPLPENYYFLEQWLPKVLTLDSGQYVFADGSPHPVRQFRWQRKSSGSATAHWLEDRNGREVAVNSQVDSLDKLLGLAPLTISMTIEPGDNEDATISLQADFKPGQDSGYTLDSQLKLAGATVHIQAASPANWQLPSQSSTAIDSIDYDKLQALVAGYASEESASDPESFLQTALPALALPPHKGKVRIDELRWRKEVGKDSAFDFTTSDSGISIQSLTSSGPTAILTGEITVDSQAAGWEIQLDANASSREENRSLAAQFIDAAWLWHAGETTLHGSGQTWGELLNSLQGKVSVEGFHRGDTQTPVSLLAQLDNSPGALNLSQMQVQLGEGQVTGSLALSGTGQRKLAITLAGEKLDLGFLFPASDEAAKPGMELPAYLGALPGVELDWNLDIKGLTVPGIKLATAEAKLQRDTHKGYFLVDAAGTSGGKLKIELNAARQPGAPSDIALTVDMADLDIPQLLQQDMLFHSRSSGHLSFNSRGKGIKEVFTAMSGDTRLTIDLHKDNDWTRKSNAKEQLRFSGQATMVIEDERILGVKITELDIDSLQQDVTGTLSLVASRSPWLVADLQAGKLNIDGLLALVPESTEAADQTDLLESIKRLGAAQVSLDAKSVELRGNKLRLVQFETNTTQDDLKISKLNFTFEGNPLRSSGEVNWQGDSATLNAQVQITDFDLDRFIIAGTNIKKVPVSGSLALQSSGSKFSELLANLTGSVKLADRQSQAGNVPDSPRYLDMQIRREADGMAAQISRLAWGESELAGKLHYVDGTPSRLKVDIHGGSLSLLPWEQAQDETQAAANVASSGSRLTQTARRSAGFVGNALLSPVRLLTGPGEAEAGDKFFSSDPLPFDAINKYQLDIKGKLDKLESSASILEALEFSATTAQGKLVATLAAGSVNHGSARAELQLDTTITPPAVKFDLTFDQLRGHTQPPGPPRSGFASLSSTGTSSAELAARLNGQGYVEVGRGPFNYRNQSLMSADVATSLFQALIPGIKQSKPELECAVVLATFKDGAGITPYGYAARTHEANLIGRVEVDLKKEMVRMKFDSRSHEGVGLAMGNVFSNTVRLQGPITDPRIVPNTSAIIWRGWAAVMTAGLSVVGETVFKRALASSNPCDSIKKDIRKDLCATDQPVAASPLVCPARQKAK